MRRATKGPIVATLRGFGAQHNRAPLVTPPALGGAEGPFEDVDPAEESARRGNNHNVD